ncbi:14306_t:CDS:2 [Entrophospora sp. SA101]|nr:14306_t:CDS:2 [Entrophospora sp. SA101]
MYRMEDFKRIVEKCLMRVPEFLQELAKTFVNSALSILKIGICCAISFNKAR